MESILPDTGNVNDVERGELTSTNVGNRSNCFDKNCSLLSWLDRANCRQFFFFMIGLAIFELGIAVVTLDFLNSLGVDAGLVHMFGVLLLFLFVASCMCLSFNFQEKQLRKEILKAEASRRRTAARNRQYELPPMELDDEEERTQKELDEVLRRQKEERLQQRKTICSQENSSSLIEGGKELDIPVIKEGENCNETGRSVSIQVHNAPINLEESPNSTETTQQVHDTPASSEKQTSRPPLAATAQKSPAKLKKPEQSKTKDASAQKSTKTSPLKTVKLEEANKGDSQAGKETRQPPSEESAEISTVFSSEKTLPTDRSSATDNNDELPVDGIASGNSIPILEKNDGGMQENSSR